MPLGDVPAAARILSTRRLCMRTWQGELSNRHPVRAVFFAEEAHLLFGSFLRLLEDVGQPLSYFPRFLEPTPVASRTPEPLSVSPRMDAKPPPSSACDWFQDPTKI